MNLSDRILILDDSRFAVEQLQRILTSLGYKDVETFSKARLALERLESAHAEQRPFQIVFLDLVMPEMTGMDFLTAVRNHIQRDHLKVIVVTSESRANLILDLVEQGAFNYVKKPYTPKQIEGVLKERLLAS